MTPSIKNHHGRLWLLGVTAILLLDVASALVWRWLRPPVPPEIPLDGIEPEMAQAFVDARDAVVQNPRSGAAWGTMAQTLMANELYPEITLVCLQHAQRLEPENPRWAYYTGA